MPKKIRELKAMPRYTVIIQWSEEDQAYVVSLPEWGGCKTHGNSYEEAAKNAQEVLELLIDSHNARSEGPLPAAKLFHYPGADVTDLREESPIGNRKAG